MQSQDQAGPGQAASWAFAPAAPTVDSKPAARLTNGVWRVAGQLPEATRPSLGGRAARNLRRNRPSTAGPGPARPNSGAGPALCRLQSLLASRHSGHSPRGKPRVAAASSGRAGTSRATPPYPHGTGPHRSRGEVRAGPPRAGREDSWTRSAEQARPSPGACSLAPEGDTFAESKGRNCDRARPRVP